MKVGFSNFFKQYRENVHRIRNNMQEPLVLHHFPTNGRFFFEDIQAALEPRGVAESPPASQSAILSEDRVARSTYIKKHE